GLRPVDEAWTAAGQSEWPPLGPAPEPAPAPAPREENEDSADELRQPKLLRMLKSRVASIKKTFAGAEKAVTEVYHGLNDPEYNQPPKLEGNSPEAINRISLQVACFVACMTAMGYSFDVFFGHCMAAGRKARPGTGRWLLGRQVRSYMEVDGLVPKTEATIRPKCCIV
ncbi:unnamed protein product, partial [Prorocentrum cordatum]